MEGTLFLYLAILGVCMLLSAFFSSSETAFISLQRVRVKHLVSTGVEGADRVGRMAERPERLLATVLVGNNLVNTAAAVLGASIAGLFLGPTVAMVAATVGITLLLLIFAEVIPKAMAARRGERLAFLFIRPLEWVGWLLFPVTVVLEWLGRVVGGSTIPRAAVTEDEIRTMVSVGREEGVVEKAEAEMVHKVFRFGDRIVGDVMTPRPDIIWVEKKASVAEFLEIYAQFPHSRFPVYEEETDNAVGMLWIKDVLMAQARGSIEEEGALDQLVRPIIFIPEQKKVGELFAEMRLEGNQVAMAVDEFGSISGIVTLQQLVEGIVGRLGDELAREDEEFEAIDEYTFQIDGGMRIDEANEEMHLELPSGDYETVAGFIMSLLGRIPQEGEQLKYGDLRIAVTEMKGRRIGKVLVSKEKGDAAPQD